jgi:hypothetical protein
MEYDSSVIDAVWVSRELSVFILVNIRVRIIEYPAVESVLIGEVELAEVHVYEIVDCALSKQLGLKPFCRFLILGHTFVIW